MCALHELEYAVLVAGLQRISRPAELDGGAGGIAPGRGIHQHRDGLVGLRRGGRDRNVAAVTLSGHAAQRFEKLQREVPGDLRIGRDRNRQLRRRLIGEELQLCVHVGIVQAPARRAVLHAAHADRNKAVQRTAAHYRHLDLAATGVILRPVEGHEGMLRRLVVGNDDGAHERGDDKGSVVSPIKVQRKGLLALGHGVVEDLEPDLLLSLARLEAQLRRGGGVEIIRGRAAEDGEHGVGEVFQRLPLPRHGRLAGLRFIERRQRAEGGSGVGRFRGGGNRFFVGIGRFRFQRALLLLQRFRLVAGDFLLRPFPALWGDVLIDDRSVRVQLRDAVTAFQQAVVLAVGRGDIQRTEPQLRRKRQVARTVDRDTVDAALGHLKLGGRLIGCVHAVGGESGEGHTRRLHFALERETKPLQHDILLLCRQCCHRQQAGRHD